MPNRGKDEQRRFPVTDKRRSAPKPAVDRDDERTDDGAHDVPVELPKDDKEPVVGRVEPVEHEYLDDLRRVQAEFDNYRKRMMKQQAELAERGTVRLVERLLPVLDNFERAISHGEGGEGVALVFKELKGALEAEGVEEIPAEEVPFDPRVHEAVESHEDENIEEPTSQSVFRRGYRLKGHVIRPAMVVVARPLDAARGEVATPGPDATVGSESEPDSGTEGSGSEPESGSEGAR
jgi:molecular chaperone GrpE